MQLGDHFNLNVVAAVSQSGSARMNRSGPNEGCQSGVNRASFVVVMLDRLSGTSPTSLHPTCSSPKGSRAMQVAGRRTDITLLAAGAVDGDMVSASTVNSSLANRIDWRRSVRSRRPKIEMNTDCQTLNRSFTLTTPNKKSSFRAGGTAPRKSCRYQPDLGVCAAAARRSSAAQTPGLAFLSAFL